MTQRVTGKIKPKADMNPHKSTRGLLTWLGGFLQSFADIFRLTEQTAVAILTGQVAPADVIEQMSVIGVDGVWIVMTICAASGAVFALYTATLALQFGFPQAVGGTLAYSFFNELGPVLGGIGFAARSGAEIAAETGTMVVTEQVDALKANGSLARAVPRRAPRDCLRPDAPDAHDNSRHDWTAWKRGFGERARGRVRDFLSIRLQIRPKFRT